VFWPVNSKYSRSELGARSLYCGQWGHGGDHSVQSLERKILPTSMRWYRFSLSFFLQGSLSRFSVSLLHQMAVLWHTPHRLTFLCPSHGFYFLLSRWMNFDLSYFQNFQRMINFQCSHERKLTPLSCSVLHFVLPFFSLWSMPCALCIVGYDRQTWDLVKMLVVVKLNLRQVPVVKPWLLSQVTLKILNI